MSAGSRGAACKRLRNGRAAAVATAALQRRAHPSGSPRGCRARPSWPSSCCSAGRRRRQRRTAQRPQPLAVRRGIARLKNSSKSMVPLPSLSMSAIIFFTSSFFGSKPSALRRGGTRRAKSARVAARARAHTLRRARPGPCEARRRRRASPCCGAGRQLAERRREAAAQAVHRKQVEARPCETARARATVPRAARRRSWSCCAGPAARRAAMCGWKRTAWQPSAPWRRWCRSRRCRTGQTPRCRQRAAGGVSDARARKCAPQAAWRGAAGARSSRPFELGLRPGTRPRTACAMRCASARQRSCKAPPPAAGASGGGGSAPNLLLLLLRKAAGSRARLGTVAVHSACSRGEPAGSSTPRRDGLGRGAEVAQTFAPVQVRAHAPAGGTACPVRPLSGRAARPARAAEPRPRGSAASPRAGGE